MPPAMLKRVVRVWAWSAGTSYLAGLALLAWFVFAGGIVRADPACSTVNLEIMVLWHCEGVALPVHFLVNAVNVALISIVYAPAIIAAAFIVPQVIPAAIILAFGNLTGIGAALYVLIRSAGMLLRAAGVVR